MNLTREGASRIRRYHEGIEENAWLIFPIWKRKSQAYPKCPQISIRKYGIIFQQTANFSHHREVSESSQLMSGTHLSVGLLYLLALLCWFIWKYISTGLILRLTKKYIQHFTQGTFLCIQRTQTLECHQTVSKEVFLQMANEAETCIS
jgi:hypothetical protein